MDRKILQELVAWKGKKGRKPLLLKGVRQVGKTYILEHFGNAYFSKVHLFNFEKNSKLATLFEEDLSPESLINQLMYHSNQTINPEKDLVIFDEIQACPRALTSLKYFQEDMPQLALCAAGSLLGVYLTPVSFPVGKVDMLTMYPMTFEEFLFAIGEERSLEWIEKLGRTSTLPNMVHDRLWEYLKWYFIVGGLPEAVKIFRDERQDLFSSFLAVRKKQKELITAYYADMTKHAGKVNAMHLDRIFSSIPIQLAQAQDGSAKRFRFQGVVPNINRYSRLIGAIDWLLAAGLITKVPICHYAKFPLKAFTQENFFKLYIFDIGILGALSELPPKVIMEANYGTYKGYLAENYVAQAFLRPAEGSLVCWQEKSAEVEFLRVIDDVIIPVEVKSGWVTKAKSLSIFDQKYHPPYRVIFSGKPFSIRDGIHNYPLYLADRFPAG
ncbi:MAG: ATP-binding protein [Chlamydiia bacterium]|nr:ATP-binding protein [Chlamydiia bacterium]